VGELFVGEMSVPPYQDLDFSVGERLYTDEGDFKPKKI
jgi:hypothetical protein